LHIYHVSTLRWLDYPVQQQIQIALSSNGAELGMQLRQLEHFVAVAEERNFTRAAERVVIVQSGLSASIRTLEAELGGELFVRSTRRVALTPAGQALLPEARRTLAAARAGRDAVAAVEGLRRGTLSLGISQVLPASVDLPAVIAEFQHAYPAVELRLSQAGPATQLAALREGRLDLGFLPLLDPPGADLAVTPLHGDRLVFVCSGDHRLAARRRIHLQEIADKPFIDFPAEWTVRRLVDRAFAAAGLERRVAIEVNDIDTSLELVRRGVGVTILPESARAHAGGVAYRPLARRLVWEFVVVRRADGPGNPAARELLRRVLGGVVIVG
jgi:DNA-binding transcriptional LysR family regulator